MIPILSRQDAWRTDRQTFYCWNSEVGSKTLGIASFYLPGGVHESQSPGVSRILRRSRFDIPNFAAQRFAHEAALGAREFRQFLARLVHRRDQGGARERARKIPNPQSIFDFVQGITAARPQQDPSGHPSRIGGQGQETVGARPPDRTSRGGN